MLLVDTEEQQIIQDVELKLHIARSRPHSKWLKEQVNLNIIIIINLFIICRTIFMFTCDILCPVNLIKYIHFNYSKDKQQQQQKKLENIFNSSINYLYNSSLFCCYLTINF